MTTTVRLNDWLLDEARTEAKRRGVTLTALIDEGLRLVLAQSKNDPPRKRVELPVSSVPGGPLPGIDITNLAQLEDILDGLE